MASWKFFLIFILLSSIVLGSIHFYIYSRTVVATAMPAPWAKIVGIALIFLAFSIIASFPLTRVLSNETARTFVFPVYIWIGVMFFLFTVLLATDILSSLIGFGLRVTGIVEQMSLESQILQARIMAAGVWILVAIVSVFAFINGAKAPIVNRLDVQLDNLPKELDGFTIAQLTDLHIGPMRGKKWFDQVVATTNELKPDLVAITGDLADGTVKQLAGEVESISDLKAPYGKYFVTGNHEYFFDLDNWLDFLERNDVRVLRNERVSIGQNGDSFDLAGVDDPEGARLAPGHGPDIDKALKDAEPNRAIVLLSHQSRVVKRIADKNVGLVLSGHTHGGQIWPFKFMVYLQQPYISGLVQHNGTKVFTSQGTGFWGPPMRLGTRSEISLITLRSAGQ